MVRHKIVVFLKYFYSIFINKRILQSTKHIHRSKSRDRLAKLCRISALRRLINSQHISRHLLLLIHDRLPIHDATYIPIHRVAPTGCPNLSIVPFKNLSLVDPPLDPVVDEDGFDHFDTFGGAEGGGGKHEGLLDKAEGLGVKLDSVDLRVFLRALGAFKTKRTDV